MEFSLVRPGGVKNALWALRGVAITANRLTSTRPIKTAPGSAPRHSVSIICRGTFGGDQVFHSQWAMLI